MFTLSVIPLFSSFSCLCQVARVELHRFINGVSLVRVQSNFFKVGSSVGRAAKISLLGFPLALFW